MSKFRSLVAFVVLLTGCTSPSTATATTPAPEETAAVRVIRLEHAVAEDLAGVLRDTMRKRIADPNQSTTTDRATAEEARPMVITAHPETNSILVSAPVARMREIVDLVAQLDRQ